MSSFECLLIDREPHGLGRREIVINDFSGIEREICDDVTCADHFPNRQIGNRCELAFAAAANDVRSRKAAKTCSAHSRVSPTVSCFLARIRRRVRLPSGQSVGAIVLRQ